MKQALIQDKTLFRKWYRFWSDNTLIAKQLATQTGLKRISQQAVDQLVQLLWGIILIPTHHDFNSLEFEGIGKDARLNALIAENLAKVKPQ